MTFPLDLSISSISPPDSLCQPGGAAGLSPSPLHITYSSVFDVPAIQLSLVLILPCVAEDFDGTYLDYILIVLPPAN